MSETLDKIKTLLGIENETKLAEAKLVDGTTIGTDAEAFEDGALVFVINEEGEKLPLPTGEYELTDGTMLNVVDGEIKGKKEEQVEAEKEEELSKEIDLSNYLTKAEFLSAIETLTQEFQNKFDEFKTTSGEELSKVKKLSAEKTFKHRVSAKETVDNKIALCSMSAQDRVFHLLNSNK
tara:strand:- start:2025 stop:2561 length:537 start_codon:yes stop_codon:yes gene_type:complete